MYHDNSDFSSDFPLKLLSANIIHTYRLEKFNNTTLQQLFGFTQFADLIELHLYKKHI